MQDGRGARLNAADDDPHAGAIAGRGERRLGLCRCGTPGRPAVSRGTRPGSFCQPGLPLGGARSRGGPRLTMRDDAHYCPTTVTPHRPGGGAASGFRVGERHEPGMASASRPGGLFLASPRIEIRRLRRRGLSSPLRLSSLRRRRRRPGQPCSSFAISGISVCSALTGRTMTLKRVMRPSSFHQIMSTPFTSMFSRRVSNSSTAERPERHSST
jgi:putative component of membrane protein insertase Oxa1/YidC/SpoIIIJ protein YidD